MAIPRWLRSQAALSGLKLLLPLVAILIFLRQVHPETWPRVSLRHPGWLMLALVVNQATLIMFAWRLKSMLQLSGISIGFVASLRIHLQSMFYFFAMPMTVGVELSRFVKVRAIDPAVPGATLTFALLADRVLGAASALAVAAFCLPFFGSVIAVPAVTSRFALLTLLSAGAGAVAAFAFRNWLGSRAKALWSMSEGKRIAFFGLFVFSAAMHCLFALGIKLGALAFDLDIAFVHALFAVAGGMLLVAIPVSLAGLGPAEAGSAGCLIALGYAPSAALLFGIMPYCARLVAAGQGGLWELAQGGVAAVSTTRRYLLQAKPPVNTALLRQS